MNIGIVGLGLIGGSLARAVKETTEHKVFAFDLDRSALLGAALVGAIDGELDDEQLKQTDLLLLSLYPQAAVDYVKAHLGAIRPGTIVIDCCGVKRVVCRPLYTLAKEHGFCFLGGHPMAGTQFWGFSHARASLFRGASMILTTEGVSDVRLLERVKAFFLSIGFETLTFTTPEEHDRIIAYTSQLAHIVSNAYVKSPTAMQRKGFSAGSYKDMTRVAKLNVGMWTELFLENSDNLCEELDLLIANLQQYRDALGAGDEEALRQLLEDGRQTKRQAG